MLSLMSAEDAGRAAALVITVLVFGLGGLTFHDLRATIAELR